MKDYYSRTIRKMLVVRVFLLPFAVMLLVFGTIIYFFAGYSTRQVKNELIRIATDHRNLIDEFLVEKSAILLFTANHFDHEQLSDQTYLEKVFKNLQAQSKAFVDLGVFDPSGHHLAYTGPFDLAGKDYADADWFKAIQNQNVYISDEFMGYRRIPHFVIAVRRQQGNQTWYLRATMDTYYFNDLVENIRIGRTGEAYIINPAGVLQTQRRSGGHILEQDADFARYAFGRNGDTSFFSSGGWSAGYLYASTPIQQTGWRLIVRQSISEAYSAVATSTLLSILMLTGGGAIVVLMGFFLASNLATRLNLADMEKREMKTQLILAGKLAEVGEMSTGIAHEINNPLQVMKSEVAMLHVLTEEIVPICGQAACDQLEQIKDSTREIGQQIDRCGKITQGLLNFARQRDNTCESIVLGRFIPKMVQMVDQRAQLENIRIVQEIDADMPPILSDANQLQQVFLNLFNNAIYALKSRPEPQLRVRVSRGKREAVITVSDNGCGFSPEHLEKAFVPFFTTKPVGQGTGLGLSTVYGIIKGLGGDITLTSEQGAGSEFVIRLPIEPAPNIDNHIDISSSDRREACH